MFAHFLFETVLFFLCQKEKNGFNLPRKERGPVHTVVLNLTQKISAISRPLRSSLPPERSLRSAHRLSAELLSKTNACGPMRASAPTGRSARLNGRTGSSAPTRGAVVDSGRRADEYPQGAGRICNAPSSRTAALGIGPYRARCKTVKRADRGVRSYRHERSAAEDQAPLGRGASFLRKVAWTIV